MAHAHLRIILEDLTHRPPPARKSASIGALEKAFSQIHFRWCLKLWRHWMLAARGESQKSPRRVRSPPSPPNHAKIYLVAGFVYYFAAERIILPQRQNRLAYDFVPIFP
jgi:hypothetical protein